MLWGATDAYWAVYEQMGGSEESMLCHLVVLFIEWDYIYMMPDTPINTKLEVLLMVPLLVAY